MWKWQSVSFNLFIVGFTSQITIFQLYMWRHIDVQTAWRRLTYMYCRAPNAIDIS